MMARFFRLTPLLALQALLLFALVLAMACGGGESPTSEPTGDQPVQAATEAPAVTDIPDDPTPTDSPEEPVPTDTPEEPVLTDIPDEPAPAAQLPIEPILATTVLGVGEQRVAFLLTTSEGLVKAPEAQVASVYLGDGVAAGEEKQAPFHLWPFGVRGSYSTQLNFSLPGPWRLDISVDGPDGPAGTRIELNVAEETGVPEVGDIPPFSANKTVYTVDDLADLSTDFTPDLDLYQLTIPEAIISGKPTVIVFATPAFCTSPTCGPQVDTVSELKDLYRDEANFIHVELYDNPQEIQGDLDKAELTNLAHTWGFASIPHWFNESWTFLTAGRQKGVVLGGDGRIAQRFEAFATLEELEEALLTALAAA